jgi:hypothetical protein
MEVPPGVASPACLLSARPTPNVTDAPSLRRCWGHFKRPFRVVPASDEGAPALGRSRSVDRSVWSPSGRHLTALGFELPAVRRDRLLMLRHARPPLGHPLGVLPASLGLELVAVFSEPGFGPGAPATARRNARLAVLSAAGLGLGRRSSRRRLRRPNSSADQGLDSIFRFASEFFVSHPNYWQARQPSGGTVFRVGLEALSNPTERRSAPAASFLSIPTLQVQQPEFIGREILGLQ